MAMLGEIFDSESKLLLKALGKSLAIIEFDPNGKVLSANENFCRAIGYSEAEIKGQHHSLFVDPEYARSQAYADFWLRLGRGEYDAREYKRIAKGGREIWIQATYNPVLSPSGKVLKVVKVATDITAEKLRNADFEGKIDAISRVQAIIEFKPDGEIITANENFLNVLGYRLEEIQGRHHRLFVDPAEVQSTAYQAFWDKLNHGEYIAAEFHRIGKGGKSVWIQASYNPIFDMNKKVMKIVKFATDVTARVVAVNAIKDGLAQLADQNLEQRIDTPFVAEFEPLRLDFNRSLEKLQSTLLKVSGSAGAIQSGAKEISTASDDLSRRTEQQAASLEETAAALDQITATVRKTAEGSTHAREVVAATRVDAGHSGEVVGQAVAAMGQIDASSREISQIIGVIDEIAFQTNLLALNAGVEAARAGDAGRGFAVVASEVRALAQRSADAAKQIKSLISTSSSQVATGVTLVDETGRALQRIVAQIAEIDGVVSNIAASAQEQSAALHQVNTAVNQMDQVTQQNAAMVEEATAASHSLSQEAVDLTRLIAQFKVGEDPSGVVKLKPAPANAVRAAQGRIAAFAGGARSAAAASAQSWDSF